MTAGAAAQDRSQDKSLVIAATTSIEESRPVRSPRSAVHREDRYHRARRLARFGGRADDGRARHRRPRDRATTPKRSTGFRARRRRRRRHRFMFNRFVVIGPQSDPAKVKGMTDAPAALREIARARAPFVSRGDNSGTNVAEQHLWQAAKRQSEGAQRLLVPRDRARNGTDGADGGASQAPIRCRPRDLAQDRRPAVLRAPSWSMAIRGCSIRTRSFWSTPPSIRT